MRFLRDSDRRMHPGAKRVERKKKGGGGEKKGILLFVDLSGFATRHVAST